MIGKPKLLAVICMLLIFTQSALSLTFLPDSTYAAQEGNWQGWTTYSAGEFNLEVEFAVYDQDNLNPGEEQDLADALNLEGKYIYAYQVHTFIDSADVGFFGLLDSDGTDLDFTLDDIGYYNDGLAGFGARDPHESLAAEHGWKWNSDDDQGLLHGNEFTSFLVFSSDYAPVISSFKVENLEESGGPGPGGVPEPVSIVLLGFGAVMALLCNKGRRRV